MHFCQLDVTVHCALLHLKFRKRVYDRADASVESTIASFEELLRDNSDGARRLIGAIRNRCSLRYVRRVKR